MDDRLNFGIGLDTAALKADANKASNIIKGIGDNAVAESKRIDNSFNTIGRGLAAIGGTTAIAALVRQIVEVRGEFQQLSVAFTTMLGSKEKADKMMATAVATAAKTPFTLQEVAGGIKQLLAYQVEADKVNDTLIRLGNISAGLGTPLSRLILVYGQVKAKGKLMGDDLRQFTEAGVPMIHEIAKQMGIADKEVAALVSDGKIGFNEVSKVIENLTDKGGMFFNLMEEQSKTVTGRISNLKDQFTKLLNEIGTQNEGLINGSISGVASLLEHYEEIGKTLIAIAAIYGTYRAAVIATNVIMKIQAEMAIAQAAVNAGQIVAGVTLTATQELQTVSLIKLTTTQKLHAVAANRATLAQVGLNKAMLTNPYVLAAVAIGAVVAALWLMHDGSTAAEQAQKMLNKSLDEAKEAKEKLSSETNRLKSIINDETESKRNQIDAYKQLQALYPKILENIDLQSFKTIAATEQQKLLNKAMDDMDTEKLDKQIQAARIMLAQAQGNGNVKFSQGQYIYDFGNDKNIEKHTRYLDGLLGQKVKLNKVDEEARIAGLNDVQQLEALTFQLNALKNARNDIAIKGDLTGNLGLFDVNKSDAEISALTKRIDAVKKKIDDTKNASKPIRNKSFWDAELSTATDEREKITQSSNPALWAELTRRIQVAKKALKEWKDEDKAPKEKKSKEDMFLLRSMDLQIKEYGKGLIAANEAAKKKIINDNLDELFTLQQQYESYTNKRLSIERKFEAEIKKLKENGASKEVLTNAKTAKENALTALDASVAEKSTAFQAFMDKIVNDSLKELKTQLEEAEKSIASSTFTDLNDDDKAVLRAEISALKTQIKTLTSKGDGKTKEWGDTLKVINEVNEATKNIISNFDGLDETSKQFLTAATNIAGGIIGMITGITTLAIAGAEAVKGVERASVVLATIGAALAVLQAIDSFMQSAEKRREDEQKKAIERQDQEIFGLIEYNKYLREKYDWTIKIGEAQLDYLYRTGAELTKQLKENEEAQKKAEEELYKKTYKTGTQEQQQGTDIWDFTPVGLGIRIFGGRKETVDVFESLKGKTYDEVKLLAEQGKLTADAMEAFNKWTELRAEGDELNKKALETAESFKETLTGTTSKSIADSIVEGFKAGKRGAAEFADTFEQLMQSAVQASLSYLTDVSIREWYEDFAEASKGGITPEERAALKAEWDRRLENLKADAANLEDLTGTPISNAAARQASSKGFASMNQQSADELNGRFTAVQGHTFRLAEGMEVLKAVMNLILTNVIGIKSDTARLQTIESDMSSVKAELIKINTSGIYLKK